ncbi:MAG: N-acetyl-gamma-glutamyl-phosphate reductase, partial [Actinobacteria bacterium]|nr:N-acetyl-gamma-glutamyl-phosphate reductase [Actinomycetota bacterium]
AVIGASGYSGGELLRILAAHPDFEVTAISAHSNAGEDVTSIHPFLQAYSGRKFIEVTSIDWKEIDFVFLALPHGESAKIAQVIPEDIKIVDLGADFRLHDANDWSKYYGGIHAGTWTYGLPELFREHIVGQKRVANPGCYATAIALSIAPVISFIEGDIVVVAASGTTGAGRNAKINLLGSEVMGSLTSYKFGGVHQHTPEIEESLYAISGQDMRISFTPILAPMPRGILSTATAKLANWISTKEMHGMVSEFFRNEEFVTVLPLGQMPQTSAVYGTNRVHIQVACDEHTQRVIISAAIDNLGKGAAGQAIQNANLMCGFPESTGLSA